MIKIWPKHIEIGIEFPKEQLTALSHVTDLPTHSPKDQFVYYPPYPIFINLVIHQLILQTTLYHLHTSHIGNTQYMIRCKKKIQIDTSLVNTCLLHQGTG